ncbi:MAG: hypothetical protein ACK412_01035 [Chloroherpetonaceae bacterium]
MQVKLRRLGYYALATVIAAALSVPLGVLAFVFLPILLIASIPFGLYLVFRTTGKVWNDSDYARATQPVPTRNRKVYTLIQPKRLLSNYKFYHLN